MIEKQQLEVKTLTQIFSSIPASIFFLLIVVAVTTVINKLASASKGGKEDKIVAGKIAYKKTSAILTARELAFYKSLKPIADKKGMVVLAKVRLADAVEPTAPKNSKQYYSQFNRVKSKHVDFVLCDHNLTHRIVIELDDSTHKQDSRANRDNLVDEIMKSAKLPILHVYDAKGLEEKILKALNQ